MTSFFGLNWQWIHEAALAQVIADAEERGREEEHVRCLAYALLRAEEARNDLRMTAAGACGQTVFDTANCDNWPHESWVDAARKLEEELKK